MGKTLKYVSEFTFPSSNSKPMATGYAKGGIKKADGGHVGNGSEMRGNLTDSEMRAAMRDGLGHKKSGNLTDNEMRSLAHENARRRMGAHPTDAEMRALTRESPGYKNGGMATRKQYPINRQKPMIPAPGSGMVYSRKENTAKTLLPDGKGAPMPHARGTVNMAKGGMAKGGMNCGMAKGGKVPMEKWEASKEDLQQDKKLAAKHGMSLETWEKSSMDKKHDTQQSMKGLAKGGMAKVGKVMGEFKSGELHSGSKSGPVVKSRKQAVAIGISEARKAMKK